MVRDVFIDRSRFLALLGERFPDVVEMLDEIDDGLIHLEVAAFRRCVETAMDTGGLWDVERYLTFVAEIFPLADSYLRNALEVSFIEDFALGECTEARHLAVKQRGPKTVRDKIIAVSNKWR
jgi:hypothetical protein